MDTTTIINWVAAILSIIAAIVSFFKAREAVSIKNEIVNIKAKGNVPIFSGNQSWGNGRDGFHSEIK